MNNTTLIGQAPDYMMYMRTLFAFLFVVCLIFLSSHMARRYGLDKRVNGAMGKTPTMSVAETLYLDPRRKLMRVRVGDKEHLLLLSPSGDRVVYSQDAEAKHDAA